MMDAERGNLRGVYDVAIFSQSRAICRAVGIFAFALLGGIPRLAAAPAPEQSRLELQLIASSGRVRVWDCLILRYVIRNNTAADVQPLVPTEYMYGKVTIELRCEPETTWHSYRSDLAKAFECCGLGPGMAVAKGTERFDLAELFLEDVRTLQPIFATPGVYHLRVCIPFKGYGLVRSEPIRIDVANIPAEERQFIEQDRAAFASAVGGGLVLRDDLDGMYKIEGRLSNCQNRSLLRCHIPLLEQFRKSGLWVDDDCKRTFARLRKERGDILADYWTLNRAVDLVNRRLWGDAQELLNTVPGHSAQKESLLNVARLELLWASQRDKK
jgi:hypothetical protein